MEQITFAAEDVIHVDKTNGTSVNYYISEQGCIQTVLRRFIREWHYHEKISEMLPITKGNYYAVIWKARISIPGIFMKGIWSRWETVSIHLK